MERKSRIVVKIEDLALTMTAGLGVKGVVHLLDRFGSAERIFVASEAELRQAGHLRGKAVENLLGRSGFAAARREEAYCARHGLQAVASTDAAYPPLLREINDYPHVLYIRGAVEALHGPCLLVVGTREMSRYGERIAPTLIRGLAERVPDLVIVSGLAFGIDAVCHRAAMDCGLRTVAVVPCALPEVLPASHTHLAREIVERGGAVVTELPSITKQAGDLYPARNRIIAGLSEGTVVIESPVGGGSLQTADYADGYGRAVMALPGRVGDESARGSNILIRNQKARIVLSAEDVVRELGWDLRPKMTRPVQPRKEIPLTADEQGLLGCFRSNDPLSVAQLQELCGLDPGALSVLLMGLELSGAVHKQPGNLYVKTRR